MAHFAKVKDGIVLDVLVADQSFIDSLPPENGVSYVQTSYNSRGGLHHDKNNMPDNLPHLRYNFARVRGIYDAEADAFYEQKPYPSWVLNTNTYLWEPPVPRPTDGHTYSWDEASVNWIAKAGCPTFE